MEELTETQKKDLRVLARFVATFCAAKKHEGRIVSPPVGVEPSPATTLCPGCRTILDYAVQKRSRCPLDPKPSCKHCRIHCYSPDYRAKVRQIMAFSGRRMIMRGRLDYLWHYFF